ncbi:hypothetical protein KDA_04710 [Dictyobacter alpinus]|uniref:DNA polymerase III subunit gamma/tau n=1 Tax=Dictyobacter alpinus TaxID=2014873 RepID=A0A402B101_9CHLR|nr:DNA polymerase III subunit gamma/tau [Dictyobacter alpinus]GCE24987.1 hypothetical protein KDA_04710 [Dictyobacter alpinus]
MASQSLYRKWRSQTFGDLVGQEPVIRTLKNALSSGNLAHAYLFTGPRGTGKTSMARLLAKTINCQNPQNGEPCNHCEQCREITIGSSFNVLEIDAASNRGIDSIRELREKVMMPPTTGKYKVYILDEAHMLTTEAFNALLKTLEEPPPHAIFVMATTDVHKMLPTVLSRCQRFDFKRFNLRQLVERLNFVAQQENVELQNGAAELIARAAAGGMRDALSLLDQAIAYCGNIISLEQIQAMLGVADPRAIQKFISYIAELDSAAGLHLINELSEAGADLRQINTQVAEFWRAMMLSRAGANIAEILDNTEDELKEIQQTARLFRLDELTECARIFAQNDLMQKGQGTPQLGLELAFLACLDLHWRAQDGTGSAVPANPAQPSPSAPSEARPRVAAPAPSYAAAPAAEVRKPMAKVEEVKEETVNVSPPEIDSEPQEDFDVSELEEQVMPAAIEPVFSSPAAPPADPILVSPTETLIQPEPIMSEVEELVVEAVEEVDDPPTLTLLDVKEKWEQIRLRVKTRKDGPKVAALLGGYSILGVEGTSKMPIIVCKANADFHYKTLQNDSYYDAIRWSLKVELKTECNIRLLPPNANVSISTIPRPTIQASNSMLAPAPQQSARVEKPTAPVAPPKPQAQPPKTPARPIEPPTPQASASMEPLAPASPPLARSEVVRENVSITPVNSGTRLQSMREHAESNPVVAELIRTFKAQVKDIHPK